MMQPEHQIMLNHVWAELIIEELARQGVKHVCIAPGSRSTPLTLAASDHSDLIIHPHFDERALGFLALGIAKTSQQAVAIIVTSGTAVANLLPAVVESGLTKEKLVLLTADRPAELVHCGANQAINQQRIFSSHVCDSLSLPSPNQNTSPQWLLSRLDHAFFNQQKSGGSIHINCPFPEPFYGEVDKNQKQHYLASISDWQANRLPYMTQNQVKEEGVISSEWQTVAQKKGVVLIGNVSLEEATLAGELAKELGWPVLSDPQSGYASSWAHYDLWLQNKSGEAVMEQVEHVLQFGARFVSKRLTQWLSSYDKRYWLIDPILDHLDPSFHQQVRYYEPVSHWCQRHIKALKQRDDYIEPRPLSHLGETLTVASQQTARLMQTMLGNNNELSELNFALTVTRQVSDCDWFVGNSLIIRLLDMVGNMDNREIYTNRGASGIDGLIATAVGVQLANNRSLLCMLGDTSLLYDLNSLALLKQTTKPTVIVVINNNGGGIFDLLPVNDKKKNDFYRMPHQLEFSHAAAMFGLEYHQPETLTHAMSTINDGLKEGIHLVEITVPAGQVGHDLRRLSQAIKEAELF